MNSYQSSILHPNAKRVPYQQFKSGDRFFPVREVIYNVSPASYQAPNGYFGLIEFSDDGDISEYTEVYTKFYGEPIDLDPSYLDMVSNAKKLKVSFDWSGDIEFEDEDGYFGTPATISQTLSAGIDGDFDLCTASGYFYEDQNWISTLKRDRTSRASQLNHDLIYGAFKKANGDFWEGETPHDTGYNYDGPAVEYPDNISPLLPEISFRLPVPYHEKGIDDTFNYTSQKGGSVSASFSSSILVEAENHPEIWRGKSFELSLRVAAIVVTPTKVKAWVEIVGYINDPFLRLSRVSDPKLLEGVGISEGPYEEIGDFSVNFLGVEVTGFVYKNNSWFYDNYSTMLSVSFSGSFNLTQEEDY